jgi:hypothetical protein
VPKAASLDEFIEDIYQSVLATPKRQRRMLSKTFWDMFGFKVRSRQRIAQVRDALNRRNLLTNISPELLGTEARDSWLIITYDEAPGTVPVPTSTVTYPQQVPSDAWFDLIEGRSFESEREVEYYFIQPLVEQLGYSEDDCSIGHSLSVYQGVKKTNVQADFVLFEGNTRGSGNALVVIEAKRPGKKLTDDDVGQARSYAFALSVPYYLLTNGDEIRLYQFRAGMQQDVLLSTFHRRELRSRWLELYQRLHRGAIVDLKRNFARLLAGEFHSKD